MITIRNAKILSDTVLYQVFKEAFSNYMIKFDFDEQTFISHMFGKEGNKREYSFVAYRDYKPVGIVIGGLNPTMAIKTLRCGGMGVIKEERGSDIATLLMKEHLKIAKNIGCARVYLEVIKGNDRAIGFYKKIGYRKVYDLSYKTLYFDTEEGIKLENELMKKYIDLPKEYSTERVSYDEVEEFRKNDHSYLPWQGSFEYFKDLEFVYYGVKVSGKLVGAIVANSSRLAYLYVIEEYRNLKIGKALLKKIIKELKPESLRITYSNNDLLEFFTSKYGFVNDGLSQIEMFLNLEEEL